MKSKILSIFLVCALIIGTQNGFLYGDDTVSDGGAIYNGNSELNVNGSSKFTNNEATISGGLFVSYSDISIDGAVEFVGNKANGHGGL